MKKYTFTEKKDTKVWQYQRVIRNRKSNKDRQDYGQQQKKDKQRSTKYYTEN